MIAKYIVLTAGVGPDSPLWTPQPGVNPGPHNIHGLRRALRQLQNMGYPCNYQSATGNGDLGVSVRRVEGGKP